jgi:peptidoglycan hydrolase CwlO-like protein
VDKKMNKKTQKLLALFLAGISFSQSFSWTSADTNDDKIKALEEKAENYRKLIEIKKQQQGTLGNQLSLLEAENNKLETEIEIKKEALGDVSSQVERLKNQIQEYERSIRSQRAVLGDLLRSYYENKRGDEIVKMFGQDNFYSALRSEDSLLQAEEKVQEVVGNINALKNSLEKEKKAKEQKQQELETLTDQLDEKNRKLDASKAQKQNLLEVTKGEEAKYQQLLAKVEAQKQELLNIDELSTASGLSADAYDKPTSGLASTSWFYSQKDSRWGNDEIGRSRSKMKDWGCAVTAVTMVFKYYGSSVTPKTLADSSSLFSWDLIKWPSVWEKIKLVSGFSHGNINWTTIDKELKAEHPVIIYIKKTNRGGGHYVVIHHKTDKGKYVVHDPYFGANIFLDTSRALVGQMGNDSGTVMDQMIIYNK